MVERLIDGSQKTMRSRRGMDEPVAKAVQTGEPTRFRLTPHLGFASARAWTSPA
jgi:hypothetical protein